MSGCLTFYCFEKNKIENLSMKKGDFTTLGASANTVGVVFTIPVAGGTGNGTTGKVRKTGTYLEFYTFVPDTKKVYVLQKFDQ